MTPTQQNPGPQPEFKTKAAGQAETNGAGRTETKAVGWAETKGVGRASARQPKPRNTPEQNNAGATSVANWQTLEIIVDSPLASNFTEACRDLKQYRDDEAQHRTTTGRPTVAIATSGYSARAEQNNLMDFVSNMAEWPREIHLVHGDEHSKRALADLLRKAAGVQGHELAVITSQATLPSSLQVGKEQH